jgi:hypothetical protein
MHLTDALDNIFNVDDISSSTRGSRAEGMCGGVHNKSDHDHDLLFTMRSIKLFTPRTNNTDNPTPSLLHDNVDYDASFYVEEVSYGSDRSFIIAEFEKYILPLILLQ